MYEKLVISGALAVALWDVMGEFGLVLSAPLVAYVLVYTGRE